MAIDILRIFSAQMNDSKGSSRLDTSRLDISRVRFEKSDISFGLSPLPGCNRDHQEYDIFRFGDPNLNLHLPRILGGGTTQDISD